MNDAGCEVGVVIPTVGRDTLYRGVRSALDQTLPPAVVVVVVDGPLELLAPDALPDDERVRVVENAPARGPGAARNTGVRKAGTPLVAFLDDDDYWVPTKLARQVAALRGARAAGAQHVVVGVGQLMVDRSGRALSRWPRRPPRPNQDVADYLFTRTEVRPGESALAASMVLCDRALVEQVPFEPTAVHEDWAWMLRATDRPDCTVAWVEEDLVYYTLQSPGESASSRIGWRESVEWSRAHADRLTRRHVGNFLLGVAAPLALRTGDWTGLREVVATARREGAASRQAWTFLALLCAKETACRTGRTALRGARSVLR